MDRHDDELKKVVLTADDFKNIEEFFTHFKIEMPANLAKVIGAYKANPEGFTFEHQKVLRAHIAHAVTTVNHPLVQDDVFKNIREKCDQVWYESQFDQDLEEILTTPKATK